MHDGATYYELYVSSFASGDFAVMGTATQTDISRPLEGNSEFYKTSAVNAAGTGGDEPTP